MRVLHVDVQPEGRPELAAALTELGHTIDIVSLDAVAQRDAETTVRRLVGDGHQVELVHSWGPVAGLVASRAAEVWTVPHVHQPHPEPVPRRDGAPDTERTDRWHDLALARASTCALTHSRTTAQTLVRSGCDPDQVRTVPPAVLADATVSLPAATSGSSARCAVAVLGGRTLVRSWSEMLDRLPPEAGLVRAGAVADSDVVVVGHGPHAQAAALEAMSMGRAVVSTRGCGPLDEVVVDQVTGLLLDTADPLAVVAVLRDLAADRLRLEGLGLAGLDRARAMFTWERTAEMTGAAYDHAMGRHGDRGGGR